MKEFKRETKYLVLKQVDIKEYLGDFQKEELDWCTKSIQSRRKTEGKKINSYVVVNQDEPYAEVVWKLIEVSQTNPEGLKILLSNLEVEFGGF